MEHTQSLLRGDLAGTQATCPGNHTGIKTRSRSISSKTAPEEAMEKLFIAAGLFVGLVCLVKCMRFSQHLFLRFCKALPSSFLRSMGQWAGKKILPVLFSYSYVSECLCDSAQHVMVWLDSMCGTRTVWKIKVWIRRWGKGTAPQVSLVSVALLDLLLFGVFLIIPIINQAEVPSSHL